MTNNTSRPAPRPATDSPRLRADFLALIATMTADHEHSPDTIECTCGYRRA